ncbi:MAG: hypothetical protein KA792_03965 [Bacteroidales bacterium]|nr:hypothetical protein [Bacteroidales bacterium]
MSTRLSKAVMAVKTQKDYKALLELTDSSTSAMETNIATFANPNPTLAELRAQADIVRGYAARVDAGDHTVLELRNEASVTLYRMHQQELIYVNEIGNNDRGILSLSGYKVTDEPNPHPLPAQIIIKRIIDGDSPNTAKIYIESVGQHDLNFIVEKTTTPDDETSWKVALCNSSSRELIISNLVYGQEIWFRICAYNKNGQGLWSQPHPFISQK